MPKSALTGTTWYWREGKMAAPFGSDLYDVVNKELCLPISENMAVDSIRAELESHQIEVHRKSIHKGFLNYPEGTNILYAYCPDSSAWDVSNYQKNLKELEQYILKNGGRIYVKDIPQSEKTPSKIDLRSVLKWFGRGK